MWLRKKKDLLRLLDDYSGFYSETIEGKSKVTGVGLYVHNSFNAIENEKLCITSQNMGSIFLTINKNNKKLTLALFIAHQMVITINLLKNSPYWLNNFPKI